MPIYCDNKGVLNQGGEAKRELKEKQSQFDVLHVMKGLITDSPVPSDFRWVEGHSVEKKGRNKCTEPELMNDTVNKMAGKEFHRARREEDYVHTDFPFEKLRVRSNGDRITGNLRKALDILKGERTAKQHLDSKEIVRKDDFSCVWWDGMEDLMKSYPKMYRI